MFKCIHGLTPHYCISGVLNSLFVIQNDTECVKLDNDKHQLADHIVSLLRIIKLLDKSAYITEFIKYFKEI